MRKISILNEDFIALEQKIAEAIDAADRQVEQIRNEVSETLGQVFQQVGEGSFKEKPAFVEFRNSDGKMMDKLPEVVRDGIARSTKNVKSVKMLDLEESATISKAYASITGVGEDQFEDEVHEVVFFFGKEGTNIPDADANEFKVEIKELAVQSAVEKFAQMMDMLELLRKDVAAAVESGDREKLVESMQKLSLMKLLTDVLSKKNGK